MDEITELLRARKRAFDRYIEKRQATGKPIKWKMRLRVRLSNKLNDDVAAIKTTFAGRRVTIRPRASDRTFRDDEHIVLIASRFSTAEQAAEFGLALQASLAVGGALSGVAMDVGADNAPSSQVSDIIKEALAKQGSFLFDDVHGVDVLPDTPATFTIFGDARMTVAWSSRRIINIVEGAGSTPSKFDQKTFSAALMMNAALMAPHPAAALALYVGAVEFLVSGEKWSARQRAWIDRVPAYLDDAGDLSDREKDELRAAIHGMRHFGISASIRRFIDRVGLSELRDRWQELYSKRSRFLHGAEYVSFGELLNMQGEARELCTRIVQAHVAMISRKRGDSL